MKVLITLLWAVTMMAALWLVTTGLSLMTGWDATGLFLIACGFIVWCVPSFYRSV